MIFSQVMDILPWRRFQTCVDRYHGNTKAHSLSTQEFFKIMIFAQLTGRESLHETILCLKGGGLKYLDRKWSGISYERFVVFTLVDHPKSV